MESQLTKLFVCDLEKIHTDRANPFCVSLCPLSKTAVKNNRDLTFQEYQKSQKYTSF